MKLNFSFGDGVVALPAALVNHMEKASMRDVRILLELAAMPLSFVDLDAARAQLANKLHFGTGDIDAALAFWRGTGLLSTAEEGATPVTSVAAPTVLADKSLPAYSTEELSSILERNKNIGQLVNDAQQAFGKVFNTSEIAVIAGLVDYLGLDEEYILLLLTHCRTMGKKSIRYAEKQAISLHDEGIHDVHALEEKLHRIEGMASAIGRVRALFGISSRALTSKEKAMVERWVFTMQFGDDMLRRAYEITVDTKGNASMPYTNGILERWYAEGYRTVEDVETALADYRRKKAGGSSFDVDEFFEAALKRTYGD